MQNHFVENIKDKRITDVLLVGFVDKEGYSIPDKCFCFLQCLFSDDVLILDLHKETNYIINGDVGYSSDEWEYIRQFAIFCLPWLSP